MDYNDEIRFVCMLERIWEPLYLSPRGHGATKYLFNLPADHLVNQNKLNHFERLDVPF